MNRSIALFVALAVLVAHSLAIRIDESGRLAPPYDQAFIAFRVARNLAHEGVFSWNPGVSGFDSSPSALWILICATCERLYLPINLCVRVIGVLATASSFILASRFRSERTASLITPMLLAISGAMAAAAVSGKETALLTMLVTGSFLAFERRWDRLLGISLLLCGLTRGEGWILAAVFFAMRWSDRALKRREGESDLPGLKPFLVPLVGAALMTAAHYKATGQLIAPWFESLLSVRNEDWGPGVGYLTDFFLSTASPALLLFSVWYFLRGRLSPTGARALLVFLIWSLLVVANGGGETPFCETMVPVLPIALISAQEGMITALNSTRQYVRGIAWAGVLVAVLASAMASLIPRDIGPLSIASFHRSWMRPSSTPRYGYEDRLGRRGSQEEMEGTSELRAIGLFLRDHLDPRSTVLTTWPGSIAYLSGLPVSDLQGRATATPDVDHPRPRSVLPKIDVLAALETKPDYIVPYLHPDPEEPSIADIARDWWEKLESSPDSPGKLESLVNALEAYELITIPLPTKPQTISSAQRRNLILRRRDLGMTPELFGGFEDGVLTVQVEHHGHWQVADLAIVGTDRRGRERSLSPTGEFLPTDDGLARSGILLLEAGERPMTLFRCRLRDVKTGVQEVRIALRNPGIERRSGSALVSPELVIALE